MTVFGAMLLDAYRELNSKKLFWIILAISGLVVAYFASIGFDEKGMSMLFGLVDFENPMLARGSPMATMLYRAIFSSFIVSIWLAWIATILALVSTTTIFPDFVAGGSIDLVLSKPIGRVKLFFMKYVTSLLFVVLQVSLFCVGVFLCMGFRLGDWEWRIFAAIPLILLFYSYLYSMNVLVGVWTRSALAALLVTFMFWVSLFGINFAEALLNQIKTDFVVQAEESAERLERIEMTLSAAPAGAADAAAPARARLEAQVETMSAEREGQQTIVDRLERWHRLVRGLQAPLPKTSETIALLDRWLKKETDVNLMDLLQGKVTMGDDGGLRTTDTSRAREVQRRLEADYESRSEWFITGTSLVFEGVVLSLACLIFVRRDY